MQATTTKPDNTENFDDYKDNIQQNLVLPHTQIISPKDKSLPFGLFIPLAKAAEVEFTADAKGWKMYEHDFGADTDTAGLINITHIPEKAKLPITDWLRIVLVKSTPLLAFHPNQQNRSLAVGNYYSNGAMTEWGEEVEKKRGTSGYFKATRHLLYFLDENNNALHSRPLQFKAKGGFGGSFGSELRLFNQEFDRSSFDGGLGASNSWNEEMKALEVLSVRLSIQQNTLPDGSRGAWSCFVAERIIPTHKHEMIGVEKLVQRKNGGQIKLIGADWRSALIGKKSSFGQQILSNFQEYSDFGKIIKDVPVVESVAPTTFSHDLSFEDDTDMPY